MLAWIDGESDVEWIAHKTSLSIPEVTAAIRSLEGSGAVRFVEIIELDDEDLAGDNERPTLPNPAYERPTRPHGDRLIK